MSIKRPKFRFIGKLGNETLIYNVWDNDFGVIRKGNFSKLFTQQLKDENISISDLCIFDCTNEGVGILDIDMMLVGIEEHFPKLEIRVLFNIHTTKNTNYKYKCFPEHMVAHCRFVSHINSLDINWKTIDINKHFISLTRRVSLGRVKFTKKLLDTFNKQQYIISCASHSNTRLSEFSNLKEAFNPHTLPILVDGTIDSDDEQHHHTNIDFFRCFINVVAETSSQTDDDSWREIFLTEKTFKVFGYRQLPIWFAVPGTVQTVRNLGFDVFDDVIDHSYDLIDDDNTRMNIVVDVLDKFCAQNTVQELNDLRHKLWERISNNMKLLIRLESTHALDKHNHILELIK